MASRPRREEVLSGRGQAAAEYAVALALLAAVLTGFARLARAWLAAQQAGTDRAVWATGLFF